MSVQIPPPTSLGDDKETTPEVPHIPIQGPTFMECGAALPGDSMERFLQSFERSTRRWELVVYPALFAFMVLAAYGFFLIYNLTYDMRVMANSIDPAMGQHMVILAENMEHLTENISIMTAQVQSMSTDMNDISAKMNSLRTMEPILTHMQRMDASMQSMVITTDMMHKDMATMGRPMSIMNRLAPW